MAVGILPMTQDTAPRHVAQEVLAKRCQTIAEDLLRLSDDQLCAALRDTRAIHHRLYHDLAPSIAGTWRGTPGSAIVSAKRSVFIARVKPGLRAVDACAPPAEVAERMHSFAALIDAQFQCQTSISDPLQRMAAVTHQFFATHPYIDGNGHVLRLLLYALAPRLGCAVHPAWTLHRRPYDATMSLCLQWYDIHPGLLADHLGRWFHHGKP